MMSVLAQKTRKNDARVNMIVHQEQSQFPGSCYHVGHFVPGGCSWLLQKIE